MKKCEGCVDLKKELDDLKKFSKIHPEWCPLKERCEGSLKEGSDGIVEKLCSGCGKNYPNGMGWKANELIYNDEVKRLQKKDKNGHRQFLQTFESYTCSTCPDAGHCKFAWDSYNTNNDCLASK